MVMHRYVSCDNDMESCRLEVELMPRFLHDIVEWPFTAIHVNTRTL